MKNTYLLIAVICFVTTYTFGQDNNARESVKFGIKAGINYSNIYAIENTEFKQDPKYGIATGIFLAVPIGAHFGIQPEVLISQKGFKAEGTLYDATYVLTRTTNYVDIPLYLSIKLVKNISVLAGPQYSYLISQKDKFENQITIVQKEAFDNEIRRKTTFCFIGGFELNISKIVISGRIGWDLFKNNDSETKTIPRYKNKWYQATMGYCF